MLLAPLPTNPEAAGDVTRTQCRFQRACQQDNQLDLLYRHRTGDGSQPPSRPGSSLMTGDVSVIVTCIFGSVQDVRTMAASATEPVTSYFSGVTTWETERRFLFHFLFDQPGAKYHQVSE